MRLGICRGAKAERQGDCGDDAECGSSISVCDWFGCHLEVSFRENNKRISAVMPLGNGTGADRERLAVRPGAGFMGMPSRENSFP